MSIPLPSSMMFQCEQYLHATAVTTKNNNAYILSDLNLPSTYSWIVLTIDTWHHATSYGSACPIWRSYKACQQI